VALLSPLGGGHASCCCWGMMASPPVSGDTNRARLAVTRILVADEHASSRSALGMLFVGEGFEVVLAASGHEALQLLASRSVELVLAEWRRS
jgi:PleD family two-component response regulator